MTIKSFSEFKRSAFNIHILKVNCHSKEVGWVYSVNELIFTLLVYRVCDAGQWCMINIRSDTCRSYTYSYLFVVLHLRK